MSWKVRENGSSGKGSCVGDNGDSPGITLFLWGLGPAQCVAQSQGNLAVSISAALAGSFFSPSWDVDHTVVILLVQGWWPSDGACMWELCRGCLWLRINPQVGHPCGSGSSTGLWVLLLLGCGFFFFSPPWGSKALCSVSFITNVTDWVVCKATHSLISSHPVWLYYPGLHW